MDSGIVDAWDSFSEAVSRLYGGDLDRGALGAEVGEPTLEAVADRSAELTNAIAVSLEGGKNDPELETATLAAATIDVVVAAEVFHSRLFEADTSDIEANAPGVVELEERRPFELESVAALLELADNTFPESMLAFGGGALGSSDVERLAKDTIDDLLGSGAEAAGKFGAGLCAGAGAHLLGVLEGVGVIHDLGAHLAGHSRHGFRLLQSAIDKLIALTGPEPITEALNHFSLDEINDRIADGFPSISERIVGAAVRVKRSEEKVEAALQGEGEVDQRMLEGELGKLGRHYGKNMRWSRRLATAMKWLGLPVIALTGGAPGAIALAGASGVGLTYVLFSLAGRLETLPAPVQRVHGVPTVVLDCMS